MHERIDRPRVVSSTTESVTRTKINYKNKIYIVSVTSADDAYTNSNPVISVSLENEMIGKSPVPLFSIQNGKESLQAGFDENYRKLLDLIKSGAITTASQILEIFEQL